MVTSVHALMVYKIFCFLFDEKLNSRLKLAPVKLLTNFENPLVNNFKESNKS
jgi:hypothetical protein